MSEASLNIAVIGTGVAGLTAAYLLQKRHVVTLYEKNNYVGGHNNTVLVPGGPDKGKPMDTGFLFLDNRSFPTFHRLLEKLEVPVRPSDFSFAFWDEKSGLQYALTGFNGLFAQRPNLLNTSFWLLLREMGWFKVSARRDLADGGPDGASLGEYLEERGYSKGFIQDYLLPLGSSLWSTSVRELAGFPALAFLKRLQIQGFLGGTGSVQWQTIEGGTQSFVKAVLKTFKTRVRLSEPVEEVKRKGNQVFVRARGGGEQAYDQVVLACHADEALSLLAEPSEEEKRLLSPWAYQKNYAVLHTDRDILPSHSRGWAPVNYIREKETTLPQPVSVTYHLNRIQGFESHDPYFVTLNRLRPIPERHVVKETYYTHPTFTRAAVETQKELPSLNGLNNTYFCGGYFGLGSHEDAVKSAIDVAQRFGLGL